jgi:toxin ParE1/3/4
MRRAFSTLRQNPRIGVAADYLGPGLRAFHVERHILYYSIEDEAITIIRILHERADPARQLFTLE